MPSKTTTLYSNGGNPYTLSSSFTETGTSTPNNYSTINLQADLIPISNYWATSNPSTLAIYWHDNRENVDKLANSITFYGINEGETKTVSATIPVYHKEDGTLSGYAYAYFTKGSTTSSFAPNSGGVATDLTPLTNIDRYPLITGAPNFTDEENPTITYTTNVGFENARVYACISLTGATDDIPYREINYTMGNYTFELTETERNILRSATPNSNTLNVMFFLRTDAGGSSYYSDITKQMTIVNANPTFTHTETETNQKVINVLGTNNANTIIENASIVDITVNPTALKSSTIYNVVINHGDKAYVDDTSPYVCTIPVTTNTFRINVVDSRGNFSREYVTKTLVNYKGVQINAFSFKRENPTSSNIILNLEANYTQATFGTTPNVPTVSWKLENGNFVTIPSSNYVIDTTNNKLTITNYELTNVLSYTLSGQFYIKIEDLLTETQDGGINGQVLKGIPTYDEGEHDLQVNGDLFIADVNGENAINVKDYFLKKPTISTDSNGWKVVDYGVVKKYFINKEMSSITFQGNNWGFLSTTVNLPAEINSFNGNTMSASINGYCSDGAVDIISGINDGANNFPITWRNKYSGQITADVIINATITKYLI